MTPEAFDWNELGWIAEGHKALVAAKDALSPELFREVEACWNIAAPGEAFDVRRAVALLLRVAFPRMTTSSGCVFGGRAFGGASCCGSRRCPFAAAPPVFPRSARWKEGKTGKRSKRSKRRRQADPQRQWVPRPVPQ
jgi:hypothetical protein